MMIRHSPLFVLSTVASTTVQVAAKHADVSLRSELCLVDFLGGACLKTELEKAGPGGLECGRQKV